MRIETTNLSMPEGYQFFNPSTKEVAPKTPLVINAINDKYGRFMKGPIPLNWVQAASKLPGKSLHVAIVLWFLVGIKKSKTVKLTQLLLTQFGVNRNSKYRALKALAEAGLITFCSTSGKNPLVTILDIPKE